MICNAVIQYQQGNPPSLGAEGPTEVTFIRPCCWSGFSFLFLPLFLLLFPPHKLQMGKSEQPSPQPQTKVACCRWLFYFLSEWEKIWWHETACHALESFPTSMCHSLALICTLSCSQCTKLLKKKERKEKTTPCFAFGPVPLSGYMLLHAFL